MRPYPEEVARVIQAGVGAHFAPELRSTYAQAQLAFSALLFMVLQRDFDGIAEDLVRSNRELRALLGEADAALAHVAGDDAAAARASIAALPAPAADVRLSSLRAEYDALRDAFAKLAPLLEPAADDARLAPLREVRARAFAWFAADAKRRSVPVLG
jgi:hypothetical protein